MPRVDEKLLGLQVLRGLAALSILVFHLQWYTERDYHPGAPWVGWIPEIFAQGVQLFFSISGYLMAWLLDVRKNRHFLLRRVLRIYPPYLLAVAIVLSGRILFGGGSSIRWSDWVSAMTLLPIQRATNILVVEWTLVYEVFFYLICTVFSVGERRRLYPWFLLAWTALILAFPDADPALRKTFPEIIFSTRNLYFIFGGLAYYVRAGWIERIPRQASPRVWRWVATLSLAFFVLTHYALGRAYQLPPALNTCLLSHSVTYAAALAIFLLAVVHLPLEPPAWLVRLGDHSYGIYLVHANVLYLTYRILTAAGFQTGLPAVLFVFGCALFAGWQFGRLDVALQSWLKTNDPGWHPALRLAAAAVVLFAIGLDIQSRGLLALRRAGLRLGLIAPVTASEFDASLVLRESQPWGWFDSIRVEGKYTVSLGGWAVDRVLQRPPKTLVLTAGNRTWPVSIRWQARPDAAATAGLDSDAEIGWVAKTDCRDLPAGRHPLKMYVPTADGRYVAARSRSARIIEVLPTGRVRIIDDPGGTGPAPAGSRHSGRNRP